MREMSVEDILRLAHPSPISCSAECDHGCDIPIEPGQNPAKVALDHGWTVVAWVMPGGEHDDHRVMFCQPQCHYEWLRARMLAEPRYVQILPEMDARAAHLAKDIAQHRHHRDH